MDNEYSHSAVWSVEDDAWVATVKEFPSLSWIDITKIEASQGLIVLVDNVVGDLRANGEPVPLPQ